MTVRNTISLVVVAASLGAIAAKSWIRPIPTVMTVHDTVSVEVVRQGEAKTVTGPLRILWKTLPPETVLVSLPGTDPRAAAFCAPLAHPDSGSQADTSKPAVAPTATLVLQGGRLDGHHLELDGFTNLGSARRYVFPTIHRGPTLLFKTDGDSVIVQQHRSISLPPFLRDLLLVGGGVTVGAVAARHF